MAMSKCIKCEGTLFEVVEKTPISSNFKLNFVQCNRCGGVVGVLDYFNIGQLIHELAKELNVRIKG